MTLRPHMYRDTQSPPMPIRGLWGFPNRVFMSLAACTVSICLLSPPARAQPKADPLTHLSELLADPAEADAALAALAATEDKDLAPLFVALSRSQDPGRRAFAVTALRNIAGKDSAAVLLERLRKDPDVNVRLRALGYLIDLDAVTPDDLLETIKAKSEPLQCLAADALVSKGRGRSAAAVLGKLASGKDPAVAAMAGTALLAMGRSEQISHLLKLVDDPKTPARVVSNVMEQIRRHKIEAGAALAERVAGANHRPNLRVSAYEALSAVSADGTGKLADAIRASRQTVVRVNLLLVLSDREDCTSYLKSFSKRSDSVGVLSRFELARAAGGESAAQAAQEAMRLGHPVVVSYLLARARQDVDRRGRQADFYTLALLAYIRSVKTGASQMQPEHIAAARAATLLADLGSRGAMAGLREILAGRHSAIKRAAAAGLLRTKNVAACELARPLLKSPYEELAIDAALTLGRFGVGDATEYLTGIISRPGKRSPLLRAQAGWYLLKIAGRGKDAAAALAKTVK